MSTPFYSEKPAKYLPTVASLAAGRQYRFASKESQSFGGSKKRHSLNDKSPFVTIVTFTATVTDSQSKRGVKVSLERRFIFCW